MNPMFKSSAKSREANLGEGFGAGIKISISDRLLFMSVIGLRKKNIRFSAKIDALKEALAAKLHNNDDLNTLKYYGFYNIDYQHLVFKYKFFSFGGLQSS
ncbi:MAG: hypothetical protein U1C46_05955 [Bacteroidales bacterium]|nr:hypothetical protein [Bacteroidales bacterium]